MKFSFCGFYLIFLVMLSRHTINGWFFSRNNPKILYTRLFSSSFPALPTVSRNVVPIRDELRRVNSRFLDYVPGEASKLVSLVDKSIRKIWHANALLKRERMQEPEVMKITCLSFYHFYSISEEEIESINSVFEQKLANLSDLVKGTLLISTEEGINGQFVVPTHLLPFFLSVLQSFHPVLFSPEKMSLNIGKEILIPISPLFVAKLRFHKFLKNEEEFVKSFDASSVISRLQEHPKIQNEHSSNMEKLILQRDLQQFSQEMFVNQYKLLTLERRLARDLLDFYKSHFPFARLTLKRKNKVLTDGINLSSSISADSSSPLTDSTSDLRLNWDDAGPQLSPEKWHEELKSNLPMIKQQIMNQPNEGKLRSENSSVPFLIGNMVFHVFFSFSLKLLSF
jgi:hypothetical protein